MIQDLPILFFSDHAACLPAVQASTLPPPASSAPGQQGTDGSSGSGPGRLKFVAGVAGNAIGFAALIAGCWLGLQVLQAFLLP